MISWQALTGSSDNGERPATGRKDVWSENFQSRRSLRKGSDTAAITGAASFSGVSFAVPVRADRKPVFTGFGGSNPMGRNPAACACSSVAGCFLPAVRLVSPETRRPEPGSTATPGRYTGSVHRLRSPICGRAWGSSRRNCSGLANS